jgi:hypothetical protein
MTNQAEIQKVIAALDFIAKHGADLTNYDFSLSACEAASEITNYDLTFAKCLNRKFRLDAVKVMFEQAIAKAA